MEMEMEMENNSWYEDGGFRRSTSQPDFDGIFMSVCPYEVWLIYMCVCVCMGVKDLLEQYEENQLIKGESFH